MFALINTFWGQFIAYVKPRKPKLRPYREAVDPQTIRAVCYGCFRPQGHCYCDHIPLIQNKTRVLILQHQKERAHPFNTARMVTRALENSVLIFGRNENLEQRVVGFIQSSAALLYPGRNSRLLSDLDESERPDQLVILDGTWHHAKTLLRDIPAVRELPRYQLAPATPGQYRIRLEPTDNSLSTVEAVVTALKALEPETIGLDRLIESFNKMVETQLAHPNATYDGIALEQRTQPKPNIPYCLIHDLDNVVIAYGESAGGERQLAKENSDQRRLPIYWVAQRIGSNERFRCAIHYENRRIGPDVYEHLELEPSDFADSVGCEEFRHRWHNFLRPSDTLAVYNQSTIDLLRNIDIEVGPRLVLKCVQLSGERRNGALESVLRRNRIENEPTRLRGRAGQRLAGLIAFVKHLNKIGQGNAQT